MIAVLELVVVVVENQLRAEIACPTAHAAGRAIDNHAPVGFEFQELLRIGKGHLQIVVGVVADADARGQVVVRQNHLTEQQLTVHGAQGVHQIEGVGVQLVHPLNQADELFIGIARCAHRLHKEPVALALNHLAIAEGLIDFVGMEGQADAPQARFGSVGQQSGIDLLLPNGDHGHKQRLAVFRQQGVNLLHRMEQGLVRVAGQIRQKAALDNVHPGTGKPADHIPDGLPTELPVVDVSPVPEGAVQKFYLTHLAPPFRIQRLKIMSATSKSKGSLMSQASTSLTGIR